jgi:hypothetical protein
VKFVPGGFDLSVKKENGQGIVQNSQSQTDKTVDIIVYQTQEKTGKSEQDNAPENHKKEGSRK